MLKSVADLGKGPGPPPPPPPPLFLDQTEARRAQKIFLRSPRPALSQGLEERGALLSKGLDPPLKNSA